MKCRQARRHLPAYATQEAPPDLARAVSEHLATCTRCAAEAREYAVIWDLIRQPAELSAAPGFNAAVWARLRSPARRSLRFAFVSRRSRRWATAVAFASLIALNGWLGYRTRTKKVMLAPPPAPTRNLPQEFASAMAPYPAGSVGEAFLGATCATEANPGGDPSR